MPKYKMSFILPTYNVEVYLAECIESILQQSIEKEILIVDDGSTDNSLAIALDYAKRYENITVLHSQNRGVSAARNLGGRAAQGEFILWIDPDDTLSTNINFRHMYQLAKQCNISVIKGQFDNYNQSSPNVRYSNPPANKSVTGNTVQIQSMVNFYRNTLINNWYTNMACFMFEKSFVEKNILQFDESLSMGEDGVFIIDLFSIDTNILEVPYIFFSYRVHNQSAVGTTITPKRLLSVAHSLELIKERIRNARTPELKRLIELTLAIYCYFLHRDFNDAPSDVRQDLKYLITPELIAYYQAHGVKLNEKEKFLL